MNRSFGHGMPLARIATVLVWGTWTLMLLGNLVLVNKYTTNYPFADELFMITEPLTPQWLWQQRAEHRVPLAKLIWLGTLKLTDYEFRIGNSISVLTVAAVASALMWAARRLRGRTAFLDAFFPLALLNFGQGINFLWWWVFNHILPPMLACSLLMLILLWGKQFAPRFAICAGACLAFLFFSGPGGLPYVVALAIWLSYRGVVFWHSPSERNGSRDCLWMMGLALVAVLLVGFYFVGFNKALGVSAGPGVRAVDLKSSLETSLQILSVSLGPAVRPYWRLAGPAVLGVLVLSVTLLIVVFLKDPQERGRALGLLLFLGAASSLVLIVARARGGLGEEYVFSGIYLNMALPALCCAYFIWIIYGKSGIGSLVQICLFAGLCLFFLPNFGIGRGTGEYFSRAAQAFERDIRAGVPPFLLAERHIGILDPSEGDIQRIALLLKRMQEAGIPQFRNMAPDPPFREVALPVAPVRMNQVMWHDGVAQSYGDNPGQASVDFALKDARFVYAVRLKIAYGQQQTPGWATFRMSWKPGNHEAWGSDVVSGCKGGISLYVQTIPHDLWSKRHRGGPQKMLTIWVNSTIDGFRICPDTQPFSFAALQIMLLVP